MKKFNVIFAATQRGGIGFKGNLPWKNFKEDMKHFLDFTTKSQINKNNAVIMGRKTWDSIPEKFKPLKNRINYVISRNPPIVEKSNSIFCNSLQDAISKASCNEKVDELFVIGGGEIYKEALKSPLCKNIYKTKLLTDLKTDTFFPKIDKDVFSIENISKVLESSNGYYYQFLKYNRNTNPEEKKYLSLIKNIIDNGNDKSDRTGVGTKSLFGNIFRYSLENNTWPILTTKKVHLKGVIKELLWIIKGSTDGRILLNDGIKIWKDNGTREFLDKNNLKNNKEHDLGAIYGFQWRHNGAEYIDFETDYTNKGVDQLSNVINSLKNDPNSRRHIICAWNPSQLSKMALPPCHALTQFYVSNGELSCIMYQRSADVLLGVPYNITSYSLLTHMIANITGLKAKEFIHVIGDTHVYKNHIENALIQVEREPFEFPKIKFERKVENIDEFKYNDIKVIGYKCHDTIKYKMAV